MTFVRYRKGVKRHLKLKFEGRFEMLERFLEAIPQTVPHTNLSAWSLEEAEVESGAHLRGGTGNQVLRLTIGYTLSSNRTYVLRSEMRKGRAFGAHERSFIDSVVDEISKVVGYLGNGSEALQTSPAAVLDAAIAGFLEETSGIHGPDFLEIIRFLKDLAQHSYEAKPITYGVVIVPKTLSTKRHAAFPRQILDEKRFQSLTDGYSTALLVDGEGSIVQLLRLSVKQNRGKHFRPIWLDPLSETAREHGGLGIALTRTGSIMVTWSGDLLLSNRHGKWILWHHRENREIIRDGLRRRGPAPSEMGHLAAKLYRCALDVSFRRTGGLFVILRSPNHLNKLVRGPEQMGGARRTAGDLALDAWLTKNRFSSVEREIISDLAALDGAVVLDRRSRLHSYGSVLLLPKRKGLSRIEGSRSRAAHSASYFGLSIKISSDGGIKVIESGELLLSL